MWLFAVANIAMLLPLLRRLLLKYTNRNVSSCCCYCCCCTGCCCCRVATPTTVVTKCTSSCCLTVTVVVAVVVARTGLQYASGGGMANPSPGLAPTFKCTANKLLLLLLLLLPPPLLLCLQLALSNLLLCVVQGGVGQAEHGTPLSLLASALPRHRRRRQLPPLLLAPLLLRRPSPSLTPPLPQPFTRLCTLLPPPPQLVAPPCTTGAEGAGVGLGARSWGGRGAGRCRWQTSASSR